MKKLLALAFLLVATSYVNAQLNKTDVENFFKSLQADDWGKMQITNRITPSSSTDDKNFYDYVELEKGRYILTYGENVLNITYTTSANNNQGHRLIPYDKIKTIGHTSTNYILITLVE